MKLLFLFLCVQVTICMAKSIILYQGLCLGTVEGWIFRSHLLHYFLPTSYVSLMHKSRRKGKRSKVMYHVPSLIERVQRIRKALLIQFCLHFFANCNDRKPVKRMLCGSFIFNDRKNQKLTLVATSNSKLWGSMNSSYVTVFTAKNIIWASSSCNCTIV